MFARGMWSSRQGGVSAISLWVLVGGMLAVVGVGGLAGCVCPSQNVFAKPAVYETPAPRAAPPIVVREPEPLPPPMVKPIPLVPKQTADAIEDLHQKYPNLFDFDRNKGMIRFKSDVTFDSGSAAVKPQARAALTKLAGILSEDQVRDRAMTVVGHTDSVRVGKPSTITTLKQLGKEPTNMGLSEARAEAVAGILRSGGVSAERMSTRGRGPDEPLADNASVAGKAKNRRVEIFLTPQGGKAPATEMEVPMAPPSGGVRGYESGAVEVPFE
ncbi:MAG: OmpA family protein [Planctomycetota bacterium]|nr:OmpA family protein [Planctomycetota bacterium]